MKIDISRLKELLLNGLTNEQLATEMLVSRATIVRVKSKFGLKSKFLSLKRETKSCDCCHIEFVCLISEHRKFCSNSCSAKSNNEKRAVDISDCIYCSKKFKIDRVSRTNKKFCSKECYLLNNKEIRYNTVESGKASSRIVKKYLIDENGERCMKCGWCEVNTSSGKVPIELEHIDGNSENNKLDNLLLLCPNCHSLTSTYKALNKGNGRHKRMKRYEEGKSY